ncbi:MAG: peptidase M3, partial [Hyphomicrobium sp.]|nr:peptidase M3 [Hyphomicrobium sp.]
MTAKRKAAPKPRSKPSFNPLLAKWNGAFAMPPFGKIEARHFKPALDAAFREHKAEIELIAKNPAKPTFANTIVALEKSGWQLSRVASVFWNLEGSDSTPEFQEIARDMAPRFAAHETQILLDKRLFKRIDDLYERRNALKLNEEDLRVLERHHLEFVRAGARLSAADKSRVKEINARLATLVTQFMQNVLKDEQSWRLILEGENDLAGLPETLKESAERAAADAGFQGKAMITLARSSVEGFLTYSSRRDLREQAFNAWTRRGAHEGETDNRQIVAEAVALR